MIPSPILPKRFLAASFIFVIPSFIPSGGVSSSSSSSASSSKTSLGNNLIIKLAS
jgi:hypothetical protein